jgi:hypothetical protein
MRHRHHRLGQQDRNLQLRRHYFLDRHRENLLLRLGEVYLHWFEHDWQNVRK